MTEDTQAPELSDAELRALWQTSGGTFYSANREVGSMPVARLLPFLRGRASTLPPPVNVVDRLSDRAMADLRDQIRAELLASGVSISDVVEVEPPPPDAAQADQLYGRLLMRLIGAVCPGLDTGNLVADAEHAIAVMASAEPAAFFVVDDEPAIDGGAKYQQVQRAHANDPDLAAVPLYLRAARRAELTPEAVPAARRGGKRGAQEGGAA
ncbi:MAG: hypothetical protein ACTHK2_04630 [Dokdonella sp.]|uniref:hypothetical protein n=1 Tax=Dokdonella sp. TaxID=2291710 RepID=UPI003F7F9064